MAVRIKIGSRVQTPNGEGEIVKEENFTRSPRWGVKLDNNPIPGIPVAYYFKNEVTPARRQDKK